MTLDAARIDLSRAFVEGMGYVALSRVRSLKHLILDGLNGMALRVSPQAKQIDTDLRSRSEQALQDHAAQIKQWHEDEASGAHETSMTEQAKASAEAAEGPAPDPQIYERLREWRLTLAQEQKTAPFIIAHDKHLQAVAGLKPTTLEALLNVPGFGPKKVETYGADILRIVQG
jgi:superfamily II DNA helicase RecQ